MGQNRCPASQAALAKAVALTMVMSLVVIPASAKPDTGGRGLSERRLETHTSRGRENGGGDAKRGANGASSQRVKDVVEKTRSATAGVLGGGLHRGAGGAPNERLKKAQKVFSDHAARVLMGRRR